MVMRQDHVGGDFHDLWLRRGLKFAHLAKPVTAEEPLLPTYPPILYLDPNGGARTCLLPAEASSTGLVFFIRNTADAAETLTVEEDSSTTAILTLTQGQYGIVHCDGTTWRRIG